MWFGSRGHVALSGAQENNPSNSTLKISNVKQSPPSTHKNQETLIHASKEEPWKFQEEWKSRVGFFSKSQAFDLGFIVRRQLEIVWDLVPQASQKGLSLCSVLKCGVCRRIYCYRQGSNLVIQTNGATHSLSRMEDPRGRITNALFP